MAKIIIAFFQHLRFIDDLVNLMIWYTKVYFIYLVFLGLKMPLKKIACKKRSENQENTPCFQINTDVQLKDIPTTGEEYLLQVIQERQNCSDITESNEDYSKFAKNQSCFVEEVMVFQLLLTSVFSAI